MSLLSSSGRTSAESHVMYVTKKICVKCCPLLAGSLRSRLSWSWDGSRGGSMLVVAPEEAPHELLAVEQCQEPAVTGGGGCAVVSGLEWQRWSLVAEWCLCPPLLLVLHSLGTNHICISSQHSTCTVSWKHQIMEVLA